ncbi:PREDICTED: single Ig IL-1-related receptor [Chrysochloris asiatica]|uniref:Single Ig IL-1-related receptor n=1 Tax=Chrysochloris asiatica TaxID=185453 RepID=A0A9B0U6G1_CHRAS|nr:PREDICTED: single Ig IL-1-related receptor [Chrysochloris asiatica]
MPRYPGSRSSRGLSARQSGAPASGVKREHLSPPSALLTGRSCSRRCHQQTLGRCRGAPAPDLGRSAPRIVDPLGPRRVGPTGTGSEPLATRASRKLEPVLLPSAWTLEVGAGTGNKAAPPDVRRGVQQPSFVGARGPSKELEPGDSVRQWHQCAGGWWAFPGYGLSRVGPGHGEAAVSMVYACGFWKESSDQLRRNLPFLWKLCPAKPGAGGVCNGNPNFISPAGDQVLRPVLHTAVTLNCTAWVESAVPCLPPAVHWLKDGLPLGNGSHHSIQENSWVRSSLSEVFMFSVLEVNLTGAQDYGVYTCSVHNVSSASFTLWRAGPPGHVAAVLASFLVLLVLLLAALLYVKCRLNVLLWYQDTYGEVEMNDGKLYDAYVSYSDCPEDRKFVNFILKPQLERHRGYKLFLDDGDLLPRAEPSADLLVNLSRCRRLIVVLSDAFLGQAWCSHSFREGLCRLLELTRRPIFITFEGQRREPAHPALHLLRQHRHLVTLVLWKPGSVTPSSEFWKELRLALPRKVRYRTVEGDPQTQLQDDKDPMLIVRGNVPEVRTLDPELDPDPEGDLGVRGPIFGEPTVLPYASGVALGEGRSCEVDISDLGSRNYNARTDFYCLVSEEDV